MPAVTPSQQALEGKIIVINGFPGTGKLTILKKVKELLPTETTCLLDNHLLIDPVVAVIPGRSQEHHELRSKIRAPIFAKLRERAQDGHTILMTACLVENDERDAGVLQEHLNMAHEADVPIFWINVHCSREILQQRVASIERHQGTKTKLTDPTVVRDLVDKHHLIEPHKTDNSPEGLAFATLDAGGSVDLSVSRLMSIIKLP
ncbi:hypothetical protein NCS57_00680000 [Fusarium keratoplasticum]|uniref:Uncharacterized protein n=1 Tax=Fusarium keratoplasticum TaxID=1328300 RepID=A0ACC0QW46_9HYPO|nr:hypothetical protein NCS57_00680000 [Fusarium keratoplasticum]KAI8668678.1 hypothetical protein NCS57_00680000 [Fusarium keratoplasticum]